MAFAWTEGIAGFQWFCISVLKVLWNRCDCKPGFMGTFCELNLCHGILCENGGTCINGRYVLEVRFFKKARFRPQSVVPVRCQCVFPWSGLRCTLLRSKDPCSTQPCYGGCHCEESCKHEEGYVCVSHDGRYIGRNCTIRRFHDKESAMSCSTSVWV